MRPRASAPITSLTWRAGRQTDRTASWTAWWHARHDAMVLSPGTAKTHVSRAMIKLGVRDRAQLLVFAYQAGLVTPRAVR
jgi:Bacterial regulatory proteins, luxR family